MAFPTLQPNIVLVTGEILSFPDKTQLTGQITTSGVQVTGDGATLFLTELIHPSGVQKYKYLFNQATGEIRTIVLIQSDNALRISSAFLADIGAAADLYVIDEYAYNSLSINPQGAGVVMYTVDAAATTLDANATVNIASDRGLTPIALDCSSADAIVTTS